MFYRLCLVALALSLPISAAAVQHKTTLPDLPDNVETFWLENGMQVITITNRRIPAVSHMVWYKIGAMDEIEGKSGAAHYLEHLMFKGSKNFAEGEFSTIVAKLGGNENAFTSQDFTAYYQNLANEHLPLVMEMEADRMRGLVITQESISTELSVVLEERNSRIENQPSSILAEKIRAQLHGDHPYAISTIGHRDEIESLRLKDVIALYKDYYRPDNAVLVVSGDIDATTLRPLAEKYYGVIDNPDSTRKFRDDNLKEIKWLEQDVEVTFEDERVRSAEWSRVYLAPSVVSDETSHAVPLLVLSKILGGSDTGRLYRSLVTEKKLASSAYCYYSEVSYGPGEFTIFVEPNDGVTFAQIEAAVEEEIQTILEKGVTEQELDRTKKILSAESIYAQDGLQNMAYIYGQVSTLPLPLSFVHEWDQIISDMTRKEVIDAGRYVLNNRHHVTGYLDVVE